MNKIPAVDIQEGDQIRPLNHSYDKWYTVKQIQTTKFLSFPNQVNVYYDTEDGYVGYFPIPVEDEVYIK